LFLAFLEKGEAKRNDRREEQNAHKVVLKLLQDQLPQWGSLGRRQLCADRVSTKSTSDLQTAQGEGEKKVNRTIFAVFLLVGLDLLGRETVVALMCTVPRKEEKRKDGNRSINVSLFFFFFDSPAQIRPPRFPSHPSTTTSSPPTICPRLILLPDPASALRLLTFTLKCFSTSGTEAA